VSAVIFAGDSAAMAQSIRAKISSSTASPGDVLTLRVDVVNPSQASAPIIPKTKDFIITPSPGAANPAQSVQESFINGRHSRTVTYIYTFDVTPRRRGWLTIPPFFLRDGGRTYKTTPIRVLVKNRTGPTFLFCKVVAPHRTVYVGEPVTLTLEVWVRKFHQRGLGTLSAADMFRVTGLPAGSSAGVFKDAIRQNPSYREDRRKDKQGISQPYWVYIWDTTVYPKAVGPFDFGNIVIVSQYPVRFTQSFISWTHVGNYRRLRARPVLPKLQVKAIPLAGRPADFNGAVGKFTITTTAAPTRVPVGDPITLTMTIQGNVPMDGIRAPKLDQVQALTKDFEISGESLAGELKTGRKVFSQTIRALRKDVTEIPPIPISYFNPSVGKYETSWSQAIPLEVTPANRLALSLNAKSALGSPPTLRPLVETTDGLQANDADVDQMLANQAGGLDTLSTALLATMPVLFLVTWFLTQRSARFREDVALRRRRQAHAKAKKALRQLLRHGAPTGPSQHNVHSIVLGYVADHCNVPAAGLIRADALKLLAERNVAPQVRQELDAFLDALEQAQYADGSASKSANDAAADGSLQQTVATARRLIDTLERCDLR